MKKSSTLIRWGVFVAVLLLRQLALAQNQIVVSNVQGEPFCTGTTMNVTFASGGTTTGKFPDACAGQTFNYTAYIGTFPTGGPITGTQQVQTGSGTFSNTVNTTNPRIASTNFSFTIPATITPAANNYRVQVIVSAACLATPSADECNNNLTIRPAPTLSSVALSGSTCEGLNSTVTLNGLVPSSGANNLSVAYTIDGNPGTASPATTASTAAGAGTFLLYNDLANNGKTLAITGITQNYTANPAGTCATTFSTGNTVALTVNSTPTITLVSSSISGCQGSTAPLAYSGVTGTPNRYLIDFDATAEAAGFVDIPNTTTLPVSPINISVASTIAPATYNATVSVRRTSSGNCTSAGVPITIAVNANPSAGTINGPTAVCVGSTISLSSTGDAGGTWSSSDQTKATVDANGVVTGVAGGSVTITYTVTNANNCTNSASTSVTVNAKPTIALAAVATQCEYQTANLSATSGFSAYSWSYTTSNNAPTSGLFDSNPTDPSVVYTSSSNTVSFLPNDNGTYSVTVAVTDGLGCTNQAVRTFVSRAKPSISITFNPVSSPVRTYCANEVITLMGSGSHSSYEWSIDSPTKGVFSSSGASPNTSNNLTFGDNTTTLSITATVTLSATASNSCSNFVTTTIRIKPRPVVSIAPSSPTTCAGQPITLTATGGSSYSWGSSGIFTSTTNQITLTGANAAGGYSVSVTATNTSSCSSSATATVSVKTSPMVSLSNTDICADAQELFVPTVSNDVTGYVWFTNAGLFNNTQAANPTLTAGSNPGVYGASVTVINANDCSATATASVTVNELPTVTVDNEEVCSGGTVVLSATVGGGSTLPIAAPASETFAWTSAAGTFSPQSATPTLTATAAPGVYTVTLSYTNSNGCTASATASVTVNARPVLSTASVTVTVASCANATNGAIAITPTGGDGNYSYSWTRNGTPSFNPGSTNNPTNLAPGTYNVTVTDGNGCTAVRNGIVVGIDPNINLVPSIVNLTCNGDNSGSISLTVNGIIPSGYSWTRNGSPYSGGNPISGLSAGTYNVTVTNGTCNVTGSYQVTQPAVLGAELSLTKLACAGNNGIISLTISGGTGPKAYGFSGPTPISNGSVSNGSYSFSALAAGTYNVTVTDVNSCETYASVVVPSSGSTPLSINFPGGVCNGQSFQLSTNYTSFPGVRYRWAGPSGFSSTSATPTVSLGTATSGVYSVSATITGCTAIVTAVNTATTLGLPNVGNVTVVGRTFNSTTNTYTVCRNAPFTFSLVGASGNNYVWRGPTGSGFSTTTASPTVVVPNATSAQQGQYTVSARFGGCTQFNHKVINIQVVSCATRIATGDFDAESSGIVLKVSPNPVSNTAVVEVALQNPSAIQLKVMQSGSGQTEYSTERKEIQQTHRLEVDMSRMAVGQYLFVVESADGIKTEKVVKVAKIE